VIGAETVKGWMSARVGEFLNRRTHNEQTILASKEVLCDGQVENFRQGSGGRLRIFSPVMWDDVCVALIARGGSDHSGKSLAFR